MKATRTAVGAVALAGAASMALATSASAVTVHAPGTAKEATQAAGAVNWPDHDYMVCGTAYKGPYKEMAPPQDAAAVEGAEVTGKLYDFFGGYTGTTMTATSAGDGTWCLVGDKDMADTVKLGGKVEICVDPPQLSTGEGLDVDGSGGDCRDVNALSFNSHKYPSNATSPKSASWFAVSYHN